MPPAACVILKNEGFVLAEYFLCSGLVQPDYFIRATPLMLTTTLLFLISHVRKPNLGKVSCVSEVTPPKGAELAFEARCV